MGFDEGRIVLDSANGAYYVGQTVHGKLIFDQEKKKTFRGIYVKMKGFCQVHWTSRHTRKVGKRTETYTRHHNAHEEYFDRKVYLVGSENGEHHLQPGHHEFNFQCPIPASCPSSFEGIFGHIRYEIKVVVDRSFKFDQEKKVLLRVIAPIDLNVDPYCKEPMAFEFRDSYSCCCMSSGTSETVVKMPVSAYCPGQVIPIEISCDNKSSVDIDTIKMTIKKCMSFQATHHPGTKYLEETIAKIKKGPISENTSRTWSIEMDLPVIDVYNVNSCRFIDVDYIFVVTVETSGCHSNNDGSRRIVIGTVPLAGFQDNVKNPLFDQMPQGLPSIVQPDNNAGYPGLTNQQPPPYPVPTGTPNSARSPYPGVNTPSQPPYPGGSPYASGPNPSPYPVNIPNPIPPYPSGTPNNPPYPGSVPGMSPTPNQPPYHGTGPTPTIGFAVSSSDKANFPAPLLPPGAAVPYPTTPQTNPYASATAPEPSTPGSDNGITSQNPLPYNIEFAKDSKKTEN